MIIDSSAIVAILRAEGEMMAFAELIADAPVRRISAANYVETAAVIDGSRDPISSRRLDEFLTEANVRIEPVTESQGQIARAAYRDFGRGSGHPANLNLGDCFAYALSKEKNESLLFKGRDFCHTDLVAAAGA